VSLSVSAKSLIALAFLPDGNKEHSSLVISSITFDLVLQLRVVAEWAAILDCGGAWLREFRTGAVPNESKNELLPAADPGRVA
jgi:hypothetical protein